MFKKDYLVINGNGEILAGSGKLSWGDGDEIKRVDLRRGDVYRLEAGSVFFLQSNLDALRQNLRVHAIFTTTDEDIWVWSLL